MTIPGKPTAHEGLNGSLPEHLAINEQLTRESIVLLENKNSLLPLTENIRKVAVISPNAYDMKAQFLTGRFTHPRLNLNAVHDPGLYHLAGIREECGRIRSYHRAATYGQKCGIFRRSSCGKWIIALVGDCGNGETGTGPIGSFRSSTDLLKALKNAENN